MPSDVSGTIDRREIPPLDGFLKNFSTWRLQSVSSFGYLCANVQTQ
jgi:hypothetical protein